MRLPTNNQWVQTNRSDILGSLLASFNIDPVMNIGKTRINRMLQTTSQNAVYGASQNTSLTGNPVAFKLFNDGTSIRIWTISGTKVSRSATSAPNSAFSVDPTASSPVDCDSTLSDMEVFNGSLFVTAGGKLYKNTAGTWTNVSLSGASTAGPWPMTVYAGRLYIGISGLGKVYSTSDGTTIVTPTNAYALDLSNTDYRITSLRNSSNRIWLNIVNPFGKGFVFEWDGASTQVTRAYRLESNGSLACVIKDDIPWIVDSNGKLLTYSNGTFREVARLPLKNKYLLNAISTTNNRFIHPNGITISDGRINFLINNVLNDNASSIPEFCPSGIWEYDDTVLLYHKYALSYTPIGTNTIYDYGQNRISGAGALSDMKTLSNAAGATGNLIAGATIYIDASATDAGIFTNDTFEATSGTTGQYSTDGAGYIVTSKITSPNVLDTWQKMILFYKKLLSSTGRIISKYRLSESIASEISITWVDTSTFTTTTNVLQKENYEVEIIQGSGSGGLAHIDSIDVIGDTYTVHLNEIFTGVTTGTAKARLQKWIELKTQVDDQASFFKEVAIGKASTWIELRIFMIFKNTDEFEGMEVINKVQQYVA